MQYHKILSLSAFTNLQAAQSTSTTSRTTFSKPFSSFQILFQLLPVERSVPFIKQVNQPAHMSLCLLRLTLHVESAPLSLCTDGRIVQKTSERYLTSTDELWVLYKRKYKAEHYVPMSLRASYVLFNF